MSISILLSCLYTCIVDEMFSEENMTKALSNLKEVTGRLTIVNYNKVKWNSLNMLKSLKAVCTRCSVMTSVHIKYDIPNDCLL